MYRGLFRTRSKSSGARAKTRSARLRVEPLEDRTLPVVFLVTTTADSGPGSLRQAIDSANASFGADTIRFQLPTTVPNFLDVDSTLAGGDVAADVWVIKPLSALPPLTDSTGGTTIDGRTQTSFGGNTNPFGPEVVLDGSLAGAGVVGLSLLSNGNAVFGLNVQRFASNGITISGGDQNWVAASFVGANATGTAAAANGGHGVLMTAGARSNIIGVNGDGVSDNAEGNVISGNALTGLRIDSVGTDSNVVAGNLIGTNAAATGAIGNGTHGIRITGGARFTRVGTDGGSPADAAEWNIISGNLSNGVLIDGAATSQALVAGNYIGTNGAGMAALPNAQGVFIDAGASNNTVGSAAVGAGNIISGNFFNGVVLTGGATGNVLSFNWIGIDRTGAGDLGNNDDGVHVLNAPGNTISGNLISGNNRNGVWLWQSGTTGNVVAGNLVGTDISGTLDRGNGGDGVRVENAPNNTIGAGNTISGNNSDGIEITGAGATGTVVTGNRIGTSSAGTAALGNSGDGVSIFNGASGNTIGGTATAARNVISGNKLHGVQIAGTGTSGNAVRGNYIGTNAAGSTALGNTVNGVQIDGGAANNTIGGSTSASRNLISGNGLDGVFIIAASGNRVQANYIGTNVGGSAALGNGRIGVLLHPGAAQNIIGTDGNGGSDTTEGNLVSGNTTHGIEVRGAGSNQNVIAGNRVGTDVTGTLDLGNGAFGVFVWEGAKNNRLGTNADGISDVAERNLISGNAFAGVFLSGAGTTGNVVAGNFIGTDLTGSADVGNTGDGIAITNNAGNNIIGGSTAAGNLVSGNNDDGIEINGSGTAHNLVAGNRIGTNATGSAALGNGGLGGVRIVGSPNNTIGGTTPADRNVISGNAFLGVLISGTAATGNQLQGNYVGLDDSGTYSIPNGSDGVRISGASGNTIGGTADGAGNVISGNQFDGIDIRAGATNNLVQGNLIGTDVTGLEAVGNGASGVNIEATFGTTTGNTVGGAVAEARNVISGNLGEGVLVAQSETGQVSGNRVQGNFIGTDITGDAALGNTTAGVVLGAGTQSTDVLDNVIAGNAAHGIWINGASDNVVAGNRIGTNKAGTAVLGNRSDGVFLDNGAANNTIGGTTATARNLVSGNYRHGIVITNASSNLVQGNRIGTDVTGTVARPNLGNGVRFTDTATGNVIGTDGNGVDDAAEGNIIAFNAEAGVLVSGTGAVANPIRRNSIHSNAALGIDLELGGNNEQAAPVLTGTVPGASTAVAGSVTGLANSTVTVDFYASATADPSGFGEGDRYLGSVTVTIGPSGSATFSVILMAPTVTGEFLTATTTGPGGSTSEFSAAVTVQVTTQALVTAVDNLQASGSINQGQAISLRSQLQTVQKHIDKGNNSSAINVMEAFVNHVNDLVAAGALTPEEAGLLLGLADLLILALEG